MIGSVFQHLLYPTRSLRFGLHLFFWSVFFSVRFYLSQITFNVHNGFPLGTLFFINFYTVILSATCYYLLVDFVWRKLLSKKRYIASLLAFLFILIAYALCDIIFERLIIQPCEECLLLLKQNQIGYYQLLNSDILNNLLIRLVTLALPISLLLTLVLPLLIKFALKFYRIHIKSLNQTKENLQLELNFLKSQLNPHFLFNTMNNIYGLILTDNKEKSADLVARLSGILRYILYDSDKEKMPLQKEIKLLQDYIALEKVRLNKIAVEFNFSVDNQAYTITPLLLMPLVENAFKFCTDEAQSYIKIELQVLNGELVFIVENNFDPDYVNAQAGGIGLINLQKRLLISYQDLHDYQLKIAENIYSVKLMIQLT